jgi:hypothetical protein
LVAGSWAWYSKIGPVWVKVTVSIRVAGCTIKSMLGVVDATQLSISKIRNQNSSIAGGGAVCRYSPYQRP